MRFLPLILISIAVLEIMVFMWAGQYIGFWQTVVLVLASAFVGSFLVRAQGMQALADLQRASLTGEAEIGKTIFTGACLLLAGAFLITPGFITDITGLLLLVPALRLAVYTALKSRLAAMVAGGTTRFTFTDVNGFGRTYESGPRDKKTTVIDVDGEERP